LESTGCFGCNKDGHRIGECPEIQELIAQNAVYQDETTKRIRMKDGSFIKRLAGESLAQAASRIATPRVMFVAVDKTESMRQKEGSVYQWEKQDVNMSEGDEDSDEYSELLMEENESETALDAHWYQAMESEEDESELLPGEVYLTMPRVEKRSREKKLQVNSADRTVPSTRAAR
jgi:hypothetical protein